MKKFVQYISVFLIAGILIFVVSLVQENNNASKSRASSDIGSTHKEIFITIGKTVFKTYVSDTEILRQAGLSGYSSLDSDEAMLFVFEKAGLYGFWMKDMLFPIDIVWLDEDFKVVYFKKNVVPETYPEVFSPSKPSRYVVEFSAGTLESLSVQQGDQIIFNK